MEEESQQEAQTTQEMQEEKNPDIGFPAMPQPKPKGKGNKLVLIGLALLLLIGGGIFLFTRGAKEEETALSPTPTVGGIETTPTETPTATPTTVDKSKVAIEVQNGTGVTGEAAYLQNQLRTLGYTNVKVGNAEDQNRTTTTVTFAKSLSSAVVDEITKKLEDIYKSVETKTSSTQKVDVLIVTGSREGVTPKPTSTSTPTPTKTPTTTPTGSPSATPT